MSHGQVEGAIDEFVSTVLAHHELKTQEKDMFDAALNKVVSSGL